MITQSTARGNDVETFGIASLPYSFLLASKHEGKHASLSRRYSTMSGGFNQTISNIRLVGVGLFGDCQRVDGSSNTSVIGLNECIANQDGELVWQEQGEFESSCENISLSSDGVRLTCDARHSNGEMVSASLDLSERIRNKNGELTFGSSDSA